MVRQKLVGTVLIIVLLVVAGCDLGTPSTSNPTPTGIQEWVCLGSLAYAAFDVGGLFRGESSALEVVFTVGADAIKLYQGCQPVIEGGLGRITGPTAQDAHALQAMQAGLALGAPTVTTTQLGDSCHLNTTGTQCTKQDPGYAPLNYTWNSSATADASMTNCSDTELTGTYSYNIPAELEVGDDKNHETFVEPIAAIPSANPAYDTLPPSRDVSADFAAVAQHLYDQDHISQFFNKPGKPSDSFIVTIPKKSQAHITIPLSLQYRYGTAEVATGGQLHGWVYVYVFAFSYQLQSPKQYEQVNAPAVC